MKPIALLALSAALALSCTTNTPPPARAFKIATRAELIGGKRALGDVGDFKLSNGLVQAIIGDKGTTRGFGSFGGSLMDIDLVRGNRSDGAQGTVGNDYFTEMFPAFFLQAIEPTEVAVLADGTDGKAAVIRVSGKGGDFISITKGINALLIPKVKLDYACDYILEPGKQYLKIVVTLTNVDDKDAFFPVAVPFGFITLLGEGQRLFVPGEPGYDMRFYLTDVAYQRPSDLDALPGAVTNMWATEGDGVSYGLVPSRKLSTYLPGREQFYPGATRDSMLIPVSSSSFLGSFWAKPPASLRKGQALQYAAYLAVGGGDVASVQKVIYGIDDKDGAVVEREPVKVGTLSGRLTELRSGAPLEGASVVIVDDKGNAVSQARTLAEGRWSAPVPPGRYTAVAVEKSRTAARALDEAGAPRFVDVAEGATGALNLTLEQPGTLTVTVTDALGRNVPAKVSVESVYEQLGAEPPRKFLYDLKVGERFRSSDLDPDGPSPESRRYLERVFFMAKGSGSRPLRPGKYKVYASRGIEYDLPSQEVEVRAGATTSVGLVLNQVMPTPGWISSDFHVHSERSVDSDMALPDRVISFAVEGVDFLSSTDHNMVTDLAPTVQALDLEDDLKTIVGLELTTLEMGHFNGFPLQLQPGPINHGSFDWFFRPPGELFGKLRALGADGVPPLIQVNHPRDSILGYFNAFNIGTYESAPLPPRSAFGLDQSPGSPYRPENFSDDFDLIEVFNGKRPDILNSYRMPATPPPGPEPALPRCDPAVAQVVDCLPAAGEVLHEIIQVPQPNGTMKPVITPAFPGALDDWFGFLARGKRYVATGNSDSHSASAEAGLPRTYLKVGPAADGSMRGLDPRLAIQALRDGNATITNGPFVEATVNGLPFGATVVAPDGRVSLKLSVRAAPWVDVTRVVVRRGGPDQGQRPEVLDTLAVPPSTEVLRLEATRDYGPLPDNSFLVLEVFGEKSMWPVFTPYEVPSIQISEAVGVVGSSFGFGSKFGKYRPIEVQQVKPYAFTNPIFVVRNKRANLSAPAKRPQAVSNPAPAQRPRIIPDLRKLFGAMHADPE